MPKAVTLRSGRDGATSYQVDVDGKTYLFQQDKTQTDVPDKVVKALDGATGFKFDTESPAKEG